MGFYKEFVIKNARIFDGEKYLSGDVAVSGGRIVFLGGSYEKDGILEIDASGKLLSAGLVDIHTHLKNISCETFGTDAALCTIPFGVTAAVDGGASLGDCEYLDTLPIDTAVFAAIKAVDGEPRFEHTDTLVAKYKDRFAGVKVYFDNNARDIDFLKKVCNYAAMRNYRVMVHSTDSPSSMLEIVNLLKKGDILTHAYHGGKNTAEDDNFAAIFAAKDKGVVVDAGMAGHVHTDFAVLKKAIAAGALPDTISSDITRLSAFMRGGRYGLTACMSIFKHLGMSERDILRAVTTSAAKAVGCMEWGKLELSGDATFALFDCESKCGFSMTDGAGNCIESDIGYRCVMTVINGEIVYTA